MPFSVNSSNFFLIEDMDREVSLRTNIDYGSDYIIDDTRNRQVWLFEYKSHDISLTALYYTSRIQYGYTNNFGVPATAYCNNIFVIPIDLAIDDFRRAHIFSSGGNPTQSEIVEFSKDVEGAFRCYGQHSANVAKTLSGKDFPVFVKLADFYAPNAAPLKTDLTHNNPLAISLLETLEARSV